MKLETFWNACKVLGNMTSLDLGLGLGLGGLGWGLGLDNIPAVPRRGVSYEIDL